MGDNLLSVSEAAKKSGYSEGHIRWLARNDRIASRRVGERVILIDGESLERYVKEMSDLGPAKFSSARG